MSKIIKVTEDVHSRLMAERRGGESASDVIARLLNQPVKSDAELADELVEQLSEKVDNPFASLRDSLDDDELPECCSNIYSGRKEDRCEHWVIRNGRYFNKVTNRYIDDPIYVNYFPNA